MCFIILISLIIGGNTMSANQLNAASAVKAKVASAIKFVLSHQNSSKPAHYYAIGQKILPNTKKYWRAKSIPAIPVSIKASLQHPSASNLQSLISRVTAGFAGSKK
ncbi:hypothetical protein H4F69_11600 [Pectobacterium brasiliense]|nr:hypothetical protein PCC21_006010 [Pectobacterium carotovorum subsp. carotovorum PCC21]KFF68277.1 hypothetical protein IV99_03095 [Pectobacterium brasiliense]KHS85268.1 hypothetical protein RC83_16675 [Pectobacterium brasiliense]KHS94044.1 hypothetical protein RC86_01720 [Pectobacterium brasiliense]KHT42648.1 hypothetical protein RD02_03760 [Pectobacterium brasiliense]